MAGWKVVHSVDHWAVQLVARRVEPLVDLSVDQMADQLADLKVAPKAVHLVDY